MNKRLKAMCCALAVTFSLAVVPTAKIGPFGVDVVSAATGEAAPAVTSPAATASAGTSASSYTSTSISRMLALGSEGNDVKTLQTALNSNGYKLDVDGLFGSQTVTAVKDYQKQKGLTVDGVVGPNTLAVLIPAAAVPTNLVVIGSTGNDVKFLQTNLNKAGFKLAVDGVFGNLTLEAVKSFQKANGLAVDGIAGPQTFGKLVEKVNRTADNVAAVGKTTIKMGRAEYAAHGTKSFAVAVVALAGDKIANASVDEYQFVSPTGYTAVPNSDKDFGKNYPTTPNPLVLASKRTNSATYSANMAKSGGATQTWDANMAGVIKFATGKTVSELEAVIKANKDASGANIDAKVDAVTGATFTDTNGYLSAILAAAKDAEKGSSVEVDASLVSSLKMGRAEYAAHGTKCFSVAVALMSGDKIIADSVDDYQFTAASGGSTAVPNSDKDFGKNYPAGQILISKRTNTAIYSANMAKSGGATQTWDTNMAGVEKFAAGKTVAELEAAIKANKNADGTNLDAKVDAVTGATFTDTNGYLSAVLAAAKDGSGQKSASKVSLKVGRAEYAAHGTKSFAVAVVALAGDKIANASVDEYQFVSPTGYTAVPNSDKDFGKNYPTTPNPLVLASKRTNSATYSANMAKSGGATQAWDVNMAGVIKYATGKTVTELESAIKANKNTDGTNVDAKVDAVAGATFTDTNGYLSAILAAAKDAEKNSTILIDASQANSLKMGRAEYAAHGTKCFSVAVAVMAGDKILAASVDDYQFTAASGGAAAVPNSDKDFGKNYPAGQILISKRTNTAIYSANMAKSGGATQTWDANMAAVEKFATGKTAAELDAAIKANKNADGTNLDAKVDAVTSATFTDTNGYLSAILAAAKDAK